MPEITYEALTDIAMFGDPSEMDVMVKQIKEAGSNLLSRLNREGKTIAHRLAAGGGNDPDAMVGVLLDNGLNPNSVDLKGSGLLHCAIECGRARTAGMLIKAGAKVDLRDKSGNTPLILAAKRVDMELLEVLIKSRADVSLSNKKGETAESILASHLESDPNTFAIWQSMCVSAKVVEELNIDDLPPVTRRARSL